MDFESVADARQMLADFKEPGAASRGIVEARSHGDLGAAAGDPATAAQRVGSCQWSRFVGDAAQKAVTAVSHGEVPRAVLVQAGVASMVSGGTAAASSGTAVLGRVAVRLAAGAAAVLTAAELAAAMLGAITLTAWIGKNGAVGNVSVQGFGAADHGVAPVSAEVNGRTKTALLYRGPPTQPPDTATQHTVALSVGADGVMKDKGGQAVARLGTDGQVMPLLGVDILGLFRDPAATPPDGQILPPLPGSSNLSDEDRKALGQPETLPVASTVPGSTATPIPSQFPAANVLPGAEIKPQGPAQRGQPGFREELIETVIVVVPLPHPLSPLQGGVAYTRNDARTVPS